MKCCCSKEELTIAPGNELDFPDLNPSMRSISLVENNDIRNPEEISKYLLSNRNQSFKLTGSEVTLRLSISGIVGEGGQRLVYRAYSLDNLKEYVVKVPTASRITELEVKIQKTLNKENPQYFARFVGVSSFTMDGRKIYVAIEEYEVATLHEANDIRTELAQENKEIKYNLQEVAYILRQMIEILKIFRKLKIFHNDIKPTNILIDSETWTRLKLTDFMSSDKVNKYVENQLREVYIFRVTEDYSPPEKVNVESPKKMIEGIKSEVYSFGMVFSKILEASTYADERCQHIATKMKELDWKTRASLDELEKMYSDLNCMRPPLDIDRTMILERKDMSRKWQNHENQTIKSVSYTHLTLPTIYSV
eukprot:TRINITY_DN4948_c0_g1_i1.p1 TRINITY_DN4948_c0_g1~~TRINITY_DN4948_c0_g1_i1.p1  ORF type:complete len:364 (-),score=46.04 TRINITY_DN4948_c0_g1_i1:34-1125(-)